MSGEVRVEQSARAAVGKWIEDLTVSGHAIPDAVKRELLDELATAIPIADTEGRMCLEIPGLSSLGVGIFQRSFVVQGRVVRVAPYIQRAVGAATTLASSG